MIGLGCLVPLVLFPLGAFAGYAWLGPQGAWWGAAAGVTLGCAAVGLAAWVLRRALRR